MRALRLAHPPSASRARRVVAGAPPEPDLPVDSPEHDAAANAQFRERIRALVYDDPPNQPPRSQTRADLAISQGSLASAEEKVFYGHGIGLLTGPSAAVSDAFWAINRGWRRLEAWAGIGLGAGVGEGPLRKNTIAPSYVEWLRFSRLWKQGSPPSLDLSGIAHDLQTAEKVASEYGYPGVYHADRREDEDLTGYGASHYVHVPGAEDQSGLLSAANVIADVAPKIDLQDPFAIGKALASLPLWAKIAGGAVVVGVVATPIVTLMRRAG